MTALRKGDLVLLGRKGGLELAVIVDPPAEGSFRAFVGEGRVRRFPLEIERFGPVGHVEVNDDPAAARSRLDKERIALESAATALDLSVLRECVLSEPRPYSFSELAELMLNAGGSPAERGALLLALRADASPFVRSGDAFVPLDDAGIAERTREREAARVEAERKADRARELRDRRADVEKVVQPELRRLLAGRVTADGVSRPTRAWLADLRARLVERPTDGAQPPDYGGDLIKLNDENHAVQLLSRAGLWDPDVEDLHQRRFEIGVPFTEPVLAEAAAPEPAEPAGDDLTGLPTFTIDSAESQDLDDAITIVAEGTSFRVFVHVADVARWVKPGSALDDWALSQAESVYLPEAVYHLMPRDLVMRVSLFPLVRRSAFTLSCVVTQDGEVVDPVFSRGAVLSRERLDYEEADRRIREDDAWRPWSRLAERLQARRESRGAAITLLPDLVIRVTPEGIETRLMATDTPSHRLVAELMIVYNEQIARYFRQRGIPGIYKTQPPSDGPLQLPPADDPLHFPRVVRMLRPSAAGLDPDPHTFLGVEAYAQATSPIRRYQDLLHQRQLEAALAGTAPPYSREDLLRLYPNLEMRANEVRQVQRRRRRYWLLRKLDTLRGERIKGIVSQIRPGGRPVVFFPEYLFETPLLLPPDLQFEVGDEIFVTPRKVDPIRGGVWAAPT
jgi:exoribonuclease-2